MYTICKLKPTDVDRKSRSLNVRPPGRCLAYTDTANNINTPPLSEVEVLYGAAWYIFQEQNNFQCMVPASVLLETVQIVLPLQVSLPFHFKQN